MHSLDARKRKEKHTKGKTNNGLLIIKITLNPQKNQGKQLECDLYSGLLY